MAILVKKILALLLCSAFCLSVAGCFSKSKGFLPEFYDSPKLFYEETNPDKAYATVSLYQLTPSKDYVVINLRFGKHNILRVRNERVQIYNEGMDADEWNVYDLSWFEEYVEIQIQERASNQRYVVTFYYDELLDAL